LSTALALWSDWFRWNGWGYYRLDANGLTIARITISVTGIENLDSPPIQCAWHRPIVKPVIKSRQCKESGDFVFLHLGLCNFPKGPHRGRWPKKLLSEATARPNLLSREWPFHVDELQKDLFDSQALGFPQQFQVIGNGESGSPATLREG